MDAMTHEQYLALSKIAYADFSKIDLSGGGVKISKLEQQIRSKFKDDYETNPIIQKIIPQISSYKLIAHQPNTNAGFSGSAQTCLY